MAYVTNMGDEDEKNQQGGPINPGGASNTVQINPSGGVGSVGGSPTTGASQAQPGGGFASLNQYVNANQGQAQGLTNKITGGINDQYNTLQGQNQQTLQGVQGQVDQGYTKQNQDILNQEAASPVSFASNPGNIQSFQGQLNDKYTGPTSAESTGAYSNQLANVNNAITQGQAQTGTDAGRQQLLKQYEAAPTAGVTGLNSAILAQDPNAQASVENAYSPFSTLTSQLSQGAQGIDTNIGNATNEAQNASSTANKQIADQTAALNTNVNNELTGAMGTYNKYNTDTAALASQLQNGQLPTGYGVDPGLNAFMSNNLNPWETQYGAGTSGKIVNGAPTYNFANAVPQIPAAFAPTINNAASKADFNTFGSLNQLLGSQVASPLAGLDASQAGTYKTPNMPTVNSKTLAGDIAGSLGSTYAPQPFYNTTGFNQFGGLISALNNYQGLPWNTTQGSFGGNQSPTNPYAPYTPVIA